MRSAIFEATWDEIDPDLALTASVGVASTESSTAMEPLVKLADQRLYEAKHAGRNRGVS